MSLRKKPQFGASMGMLLDPDFLPQPVVAELLRHLQQSPLDLGGRQRLIEFASDMAQSIYSSEPQALGDQVKELEAIEAAARRLLAALNVLGEETHSALHAHSKYLALGRRPPVDLPEGVRRMIAAPGGDLVSTAWDWVEALEIGAAYAKSKYQVSRQAKPDQLRARGLAALLARWVADVTGSSPPRDRAAWFAAFCECLGRHLDLPMGPRLVASAIDAAR